MSISKSVTAKPRPLPLCTGLVGTAKHLGTLREKRLAVYPEVSGTGFFCRSAAFTRDSSLCTHGTGTGLYTPSALLRAAVQCCSLKEAQGIR